MEKKTYYINVGSGEIMTVSTASPWQFQIEATNEEIKLLRSLFDDQANNSIDDFLRAHTPFKQYSDDPTNDYHDSKLAKIYSLIHILGNDEAKNHIQEMDIIKTSE